MKPEEEIAHLKRQQHRIMGPNGSGMSAAELRDRVLDLIRDYLTQPKVRADEISVLTLNSLAGDIQVIRLDSPQIAGVPYVRPCPKCGLVPMPPCTCEELGDGEPSQPEPLGMCLRKGNLSWYPAHQEPHVWSEFCLKWEKVLCQCVCHRVGLFGLMCCPCTRKELDELVNGKRTEPAIPSGAAQEVSLVGSVQKISGPERPRCPVCGAETTCLSCKAGS